MRRIPRRCELERHAGQMDAAAWNRQHPVGTRVIHRDPFGRVTHTHTTGPAWALITGRLAVPVADLKGSVLLADCEIAAKQPPVT
jgi:hypothetical protein